MELKECLNTIDNFLKKGSLRYQLLSANTQEKFVKSVDMIKYHIDLMKKELDPGENYPKNLIPETLSVLRKYILEAPLDVEFRKFCVAYCELVFNWNQNFKKGDEKIKEKVLFIIRILDQHLTILESIDVLRQLLSQLKSFREWTPPAFELSKHYLNILEED